MKRKTMLRPLLIGVLLSCTAPSFAIYKCETGGKVSYSDTECAGGKALDINAAPPADASGASRQAMQEKRQVERLEKARHKREAMEERALQRAAKADAARQKKCATLARRQKWADEDAASAVGKTGETARRKARRIAEEHLAECGRQDTLGMAR